MMKNDMTDMNVQRAKEKSFFGKNMTFKKLFQELLTKASGWFMVHKINALDHWAMMIYKKV